MSIFGFETIPAPGSSPENGHGDPAAVEPENQMENDNDQGVDDADVDVGEEQQDDQQDHVDNTDDDEDSAGDDDQPEHSSDLLAGKYKSVDELVKAYKELERAFHQKRQGGQATPAQAAAVQQPQAQPGSQQPGQQMDYNTAFWNSFRDNPLGTIEALVSRLVSAQTAPIMEERRTSNISSAIAAVAKEYPQQLSDAEGLRTLTEKVGELAQEFGNPDLLRNPTPRILRMAAQELWGDTKAKAYEKGKQAGRTEAERARQAKQGLGATGGARRQAETTPKTPEQEIVEGILEAGRGGGLFG